MSPEQASGQPVSPPSDVFGVGILLHEMLTGHRLFKAETDLASLERVKACEIPTPSSRNPALPERLDRIVLKALQKDPALRFSGCKEMQNELSDSLSPINPIAAADQLARLMKELYSPEILEERLESKESFEAIQEMLEPDDSLELEEVWEAPPTESSSSRVVTALACACAVLLAIIVMLLSRIPAQ